eukprot:6201545-Pleurochrysis_carterae.AAC.1
MRPKLKPCVKHASICAGMRRPCLTRARAPAAGVVAAAHARGRGASAWASRTAAPAAASAAASGRGGGRSRDPARIRARLKLHIMSTIRTALNSSLHFFGLRMGSSIDDSANFAWVLCYALHMRYRHAYGQMAVSQD